MDNPASKPQYTSAHDSKNISSSVDKANFQELLASVVKPTNNNGPRPSRYFLAPPASDSEKAGKPADRKSLDLSGLNVAQLLNENDRSLLARMASSLSVLSDIARADVLVYLTRADEHSAVVAFEAKPHTVPTIYSESMRGRIVTAKDESALITSISRGQHIQRTNRVLVHGHPTVQDAYPIWSESRVIGVLSVEVGILESTRQKRKSPVFRRAVRQLKRMVLRGQLEGAWNITPLGEHDGPMVIDKQGEILYISSIAENLYRKLGYTHSLLKANVANLATDEATFFKALETGACIERPVQEEELSWVKKAIPLVAHRRSGWLSRLGLPSDEIDGVILVIHDVTDEQQKEQELKIKSTMIKEIHHRVKNNLQTIAALLRLQARRTGSPEVSDMLQETINRILSIAVVHEFLAHDESGDVNLREVSQRIVTEVSRSTVDPEKRIRFTLELESDDFNLPTQQATSCALVINELLLNSVEHGYVNRNEGQVIVKLSEHPDFYQVEVTDDGDGLSDSPESATAPSLGLQIVHTLVSEDLKGKIEIHNSPSGRGVQALVTFPKQFRSPPQFGIKNTPASLE